MSNKQKGNEPDVKTTRKTRLLRKNTTAGQDRIEMPCRILALSPDEIRINRIQGFIHSSLNGEEIQQAHVQKGVSPQIYHEAKRGLMLFCADVVVTTYTPDGTSAVVLGKRRDSGIFGGFWWMQGGACFPTVDPAAHVIQLAKKELGITDLRIEGTMGFWITFGLERNPQDNPTKPYVGATCQVCYVGYSPYSSLEETVVCDPNHTEIQVFTYEELMETIPPNERHMYVIDACELALLSMPPIEHYQKQ